MDTNIEKKRNIIPRWRDYKTTLALGELRSSPQPNITSATEGSLHDQLVDWQNNRSLAFATDLVSAGLVLGRREEVNEAADFILSAESQSTSLQKRIAYQIKNPNSCFPLSFSDDDALYSSDAIIHYSKDQVRKYKAQLRNALRDPIKLVELSREYAILGNLEKAIQTMNMAIGLAPTNRYILRSAVQLFVHAEEIDKAHYVIKRAPSLCSDPWLLAAEIATSSMLDRRTSIHVRTGLRQIEDTNYTPFDVSELASSIATLEMNNANTKLARKLFKNALRQPTENSIAQAEWASRSMLGLPLEVSKYNAPRKYEALAWDYFRRGDFEQALSEGKHWIKDQPFAILPVLFTGMTAIVMERFEESEQIYRFGLHANLENPALRNNLAFVLASNNKPDLAEAELGKIDRTSVQTQVRITITATEGLIKFRQGLQDEGRVLYRRAIDLAKESKEPRYVLRAMVFLAREEIYARTELAKQALETAEKEAKNFTHSSDLQALFQSLNTIVRSNPEVPKVIGRNV